ncbi:hypothetical protein ACRW6C_24845, partial [Escherichia coli]
ATEKEVVELVAYEGEEKERIESCEAFLELEAQVNAVSPVVEDRFAALEAQIAELKAALEEKDQIIEAQKAEIEELKAKEVAPVAVVENAADEAANDEVEVKIDVMRDPMAALQLLRSFKGKSHFSSDVEDEEEEQKRNAAMLHDEMYGTNFSYCQ